MTQISASLLAADYARLGAEVRRAERSGVDSFHFDLMDGHYAPNLALAPQHLTALRPYTHRQFHVHLQLVNPDSVIEHFAPLAAEVIIVMWDTLPQPGQTFARLRAQGKQVGLSLNPDEALTDALPFLPEIDLLVIMGVWPGFGGQQLHANTCARLAQARNAIERLGLRLPLVVDGGVRVENAPHLIGAGADILIIGTALFQAPHMGIFLENLKAPAGTLQPH
jgi:ribulose-phosphate 3-epimerase